jgi:hypothetical protein
MTERMRVKGRFATRAQIEEARLRQADIDFLDSLFPDDIFGPLPDPPDPDQPPTKAELEQVAPLTEVAMELGRLHVAATANLNDAARLHGLAAHARSVLASVGMWPPPQRPDWRREVGR